jgi:hypothetical protein
MSDTVPVMTKKIAATLGIDETALTIYAWPELDTAAGTSTATASFPIDSAERDDRRLQRRTTCNTLMESAHLLGALLSTGGRWSVRR